MSLSRVLLNKCKIISVQKNVLFNTYLTSYFQTVNLNQKRDFRKAYGCFLKTMKARRKIAGPEKQRKRSDWLEWNYNAELYAFNKRLQENILDDTLRCIFIHNSYIEMEEQKRKEMDIQDVQLNLKSNSALISVGEDIISNFLKRYLRHCYKLLPEDGICAICNYLTFDDVMSHVSSNIGTKDLIFCAEYPPNNSTLASTLKAVIGGIASCDSVERAEMFVLDFLCPQLIAKDIFEIWNFDEPLQMLNDMLMKQGQEQSEARLIFESGRNTIEAVYHVGLYSNKQFLGKGAGETLAFAEEMAAYDSLRRIFELNESNKPLPYGEIAKKLEFNSEKEHITVRDLCSEPTNVKSIAST